MPVLEVHLTPGESVVAESGRLGWFDDGIELETSTAMAGADGVWDAAKRSLGGGTLFMTRNVSTRQPGARTSSSATASSRDSKAPSSRPRTS
jgi:uncharacterized protein (AIM24 family)